MADNRRKNIEWNLENLTWSQVPIAVLMDIRDELQTLNRVFACSNFLEIPRILRDIRRNTTKRRRVKKK